jgi:hypothetical protein
MDYYMYFQVEDTIQSVVVTQKKMLRIPKFCYLVEKFKN